MNESIDVKPGIVRRRGRTIPVTIKVPVKLYMLARKVYGMLDVQIEDILIEDLIASLDTDMQLNFDELKLTGWQQRGSYRDEIENLAWPEEAPQEVAHA